MEITGGVANQAGGDFQTEGGFPAGPRIKPAMALGVAPADAPVQPARSLVFRARTLDNCQTRILQLSSIMWAGADYVSRAAVLLRDGS